MKAIVTSDVGRDGILTAEFVRQINEERQRSGVDDLMLQRNNLREGGKD